MPELPEVETTRRGIAPYLVGRVITRVVVRQPRLRWPIPAAVSEGLTGYTVLQVSRRAKYLLLRTEAGTALLHLGMSGSLRIVPAKEPPSRHAHLDLVLDDGRCLRLSDPRRFGCLLWAGPDPMRHPLLAGLGPEPLEPRFSGRYLHDTARGRRVPVKSFLMNGRIVVGVGNIYASESLFLAGIHPARAAGRIGLERYERLASAVREVLTESIEAGGTTLRDFVHSDGNPGYYSTRLRVYERAGKPCERCGKPIRHRTIGQRSSYFCAACQR
jgi:formamidopyrimidine-DNA glycosylase